MLQLSAISVLISDLAPIIAKCYVCTVIISPRSLQCYNICTIYQILCRFYKVVYVCLVKDKGSICSQEESLESYSRCWLQHSRVRVRSQLCKSLNLGSQCENQGEEWILRSFARNSRDATSKTRRVKSMFRQRKLGKRRFYDVAVVSPTVYPASSLHIFSSLCVRRTGLYYCCRPNRKREINVRARYLDYVVTRYFIILRLRNSSWNSDDDNRHRGRCLYNRTQVMLWLMLYDARYFNDSMLNQQSGWQVSS